MPTLAEYFDTEARLQLAHLDELLAAVPPDLQALHRSARGLRGTAQMAREERVYRAALALESATRRLAGGALQWSDEVQERARAAADDLRVLVEHAEAESALDRRLNDGLAGWQGLGIELPPSALGTRVAPAPGGTAQFRAYVADEVEGVAVALEEGVRALQDDAMDREALKAILRRQRALLGSARLEEVPVVAEVLRAVEDLSRVIAKLNVGVKKEWLDIFRIARDGLRATIDPLRSDEDPTPSTALARLRHMRAELLERYGSGEAVNPEAHAREGLVQAQRLSEGQAAEAVAPGPGAAPARAPESALPALPKPQTAAAPDAAPPLAAVAGAAAAGSVVPITTLEYRGETALRRALELRTQLEGATASDPELRAAVDELFDLIRLALE